MNTRPPTSPHHQGEAILQGAPSKGLLKPRFGDDPNTKNLGEFVVCTFYFESILVRSFFKAPV